MTHVLLLFSALLPNLPQHEDHVPMLELIPYWLSGVFSVLSLGLAFSEIHEPVFCLQWRVGTGLRVW